jgi:hypothetical protein
MTAEARPHASELLAPARATAREADAAASRPW